MTDAPTAATAKDSTALISAIFTNGESALAHHGEEKDLRSREEIEAAYKSGKRDKKTVCAWMAYRAAMTVCKGQPARLSPTGDNDRFNELLMEGYQAAVRRWDAAHAPYADPSMAPDEKARKATKKANALRYDASKDKGNGIPGLVYTAAEGRMRNAANELFTVHGKRKHRPDDVIPIVSSAVDVEREMQSPVTAPKGAGKIADVDYFTKADVGGINDKAVTAAAKKAERTKFKYLWTRQAKAPTGIDRSASRVSQERAEIRVQQLLSMLPNKEDQTIITQYWGLEGRADSLTIEELAEAMNKPEKIVRKRLDDLLIELEFLAPRRPRQSAWRSRVEGHQRVAPLKGAA